MKIFALIMAFTMLALSVMPCMDGKSSNKGNPEAGISKADNHKDHNDTDNCTPFCICSCCSISITFQSLHFNYLYKPVFQAKKYPALKSHFYSDISFSIWQPPKIA